MCGVQERFPARVARCCGAAMPDNTNNEKGNEEDTDKNANQRNSQERERERE